MGDLDRCSVEIDILSTLGVKSYLKTKKKELCLGMSYSSMYAGFLDYFPLEGSQSIPLTICG